MGIVENKGMRVNTDELVWQSSPLQSTSADALEVAFFDGGVAVRSSTSGSPILLFDNEEWAAFVGGAKDGEFDLD